MMDVLYTDKDFVEQGVVPISSLDMEMGTDDSDFVLVPAKRMAIDRGALVYVPGTQFGGVVDFPNSSRTDGVSSISYTGRTWSGILKKRIVQPPYGSDFATVTGTVSERVTQILNVSNMFGIFAVRSYGNESSSYQCARYCTAYDALVDMLSNDGLKMLFTKEVGKQPEIYFEEIKTVTKTDDYSTDTKSKCNHLICLGKGELKDRARVDLFANDAGEIGKYIDNPVGIMANVQVYEDTNADTEELTVNGTARFRELLDVDTTDVSDDGGTCDVGDFIEILDMDNGVHLKAPVTSIVLRIDSNSNETITNGIGAAEYVD